MFIPTFVLFKFSEVPGPPFQNPTYATGFRVVLCAIIEKPESEFKKLILKLDFQKLNKILNQVCFVDYIIIFEARKY